MKVTACSVQCSNRSIIPSEVSLKHHLSQERLQAVYNQTFELREILFAFDAAQENYSMTQKGKQILNVHIIQLFLNQLNHLLT